MEKNTKDSSQSVSNSFGVYKRSEERRAWFIRCSCRNTSDIGCSVGDCSDLGLFKRMVARTLGANHRKSKRNIVSECLEDTAGDAVVEATILFPIMIMIFAALVLLAIYLPARAALQRATQYAATVLATESSDTWLFFNEDSMSFFRENDIRRLRNVYADVFIKDGDIQAKGESIVIEAESRSISSRAGQLSVDSGIFNRILYKEAVVTATREFTMPVNLSFIGFPVTIKVTATSTAVVQNTDEFIRSIDMAGDFVEFIADRYNLHSVMEAISSFGNRVTGILGW